MVHLCAPNHEYECVSGFQFSYRSVYIYFCVVSPYLPRLICLRVFCLCYGGFLGSTCLPKNADQIRSYSPAGIVEPNLLNKSLCSPLLGQPGERSQEQKSQLVVQTSHLMVSAPISSKPKAMIMLISRCVDTLADLGLYCRSSDLHHH